MRLQGREKGLNWSDFQGSFSFKRTKERIDYKLIRYGLKQAL